MIRALALGLLDLALPRHCALSGRALLPDETGPIAPEVLREVELAGADYCTRCGAPQGAGVGVIRGCASCRDYRSGFGTRDITAVGKYEGALKEMCLALKFGGQRALARPLAAWLAQQLFDRGVVAKVQVVIPLPLNPIRQLHRGYNQAELLAHETARLIDRPLNTRALMRVTETERQALLSTAQRKGNVAGAFAVRSGRESDIAGKRVLLVDDVMTTGATLAAAARCLKKAGSKGIYGALAARATTDAGA